MDFDEMREALYRAMKDERSEYSRTYRRIKGLLLSEGFDDLSSHTASLSITNALWNLAQTSAEPKSVDQLIDRIFSHISCE